MRECLRVPEEVRRLRRHRHRPTKKSIRQEAIHAEVGRWEDSTSHEAADTPQRGIPVPSHPKLEDNTAFQSVQEFAQVS